MSHRPITTLQEKYYRDPTRPEPRRTQCKCCNKLFVRQAGQKPGINITAAIQWIGERMAERGRLAHMKAKFLFNRMERGNVSENSKELLRLLDRCSLEK
ncbi:hypothetical protein GCK72_007026 [Caenorhabditis remanei]|uniref:Uncharacterized protein n=1 Tax=Caenorhabditis remanei TaxID=31234 RepID=E3M1B3_CAERE|nr:hypothetical protein GCK72_007026 [Caenorhabditis remanei]EFO88916.1 hypothetical protein CRE_06314 [Caenorhabditis remanei]KAF1767068.1 hypothetical protein GCK72_007026 [Caenorhabditis remanei]